MNRREFLGASTGALSVLLFPKESYASPANDSLGFSLVSGAILGEVLCPSPRDYHVSFEIDKWCDASVDIYKRGATLSADMVKCGWDWSMSGHINNGQWDLAIAKPGFNWRVTGDTYQGNVDLKIVKSGFDCSIEGIVANGSLNLHLRRVGWDSYITGTYTESGDFSAHVDKSGWDHYLRGKVIKL